MVHCGRNVKRGCAGSWPPPFPRPILRSILVARSQEYMVAALNVPSRRATTRRPLPCRRAEPRGRFNAMGAKRRERAADGMDGAGEEDGWMDGWMDGQRNWGAPRRFGCEKRMRLLRRLKWSRAERFRESWSPRGHKTPSTDTVHCITSVVSCWDTPDCGISKLPVLRAAQCLPYSVTSKCASTISSGATGLKCGSYLTQGSGPGLGLSRGC